MNVRRLAAWVALPVAVAVGISACGSGNSGSSNSSGGGTVTLGIGEPEHLLPGNAVESNGSQVVVALFTPLLRFDDNGKPDYSQAAAQSITSDDKKTWTVKLKDGLLQEVWCVGQWQNGEFYALAPTSLPGAHAPAVPKPQWQ